MKQFLTSTALFLLISVVSLAQNSTRITSYYDNKDGKSYYIAWDIKTGKSIQYYWDGPTASWQSFEINLPAKPVSGAVGNIMYDVYYDYNDGKAYYTAWDVKTGKSVGYYWDGSTNTWAAYEINLPEKPLPGNTGEIMMKSYYDSRDDKAYYLVYDTNGGKSIQYYWNGNETKWESFEINLPANPLLGK